MDLTERVLAGDRLALARLLTLLENDQPEGHDGLAALYSRTGHARIVGVTGASGTGKSTLVNRLALALRAAERAQTVGIVAVDPSSPYTGGAILGDRIRMRDLAGDPGVFIRSMASRGALGGLARTTFSVVEALDAAGFDMVLIETVGAGQTEVDIARMAHTTIVVDAPGLGDDVQAIKAGILEIADILVVNKADLPGADHAIQLLRASLQMAHPTRHEWAHQGLSEGPAAPPAESTWLPPVLPTVATQGEGVPALVEALEQHRAYLLKTGELALRQRERARAELESLLRDQLAARWRVAQPDGRFDAALERVVRREVAPRRAAADLAETGKG